MVYVRALGIIAVVVGLSIDAALLFVVTTAPRSDWQKLDLKSWFTVETCVAALGFQVLRAAAKDDSNRSAAEPTAPELTEFERQMSYGVSRSQFYGVGCLILGLGLLITIGACLLNAESHGEMMGMLAFTGLIPLPLIGYGIYLLRATRKPPKSPAPGSN